MKLAERIVERLKQIRSASFTSGAAALIYGMTTTELTPMKLGGFLITISAFVKVLVVAVEGYTEYRREKERS